MCVKDITDLFTLSIVYCLLKPIKIHANDCQSHSKWFSIGINLKGEKRTHRNGVSV